MADETNNTPTIDSSTTPTIPIELPVFTNEFGKPVQTQLTELAKNEYNELAEQLKTVQEGTDEYKAILNKIDAIENAVKQHDPTYVIEDVSALTALNNAYLKNLSAWDPRLQRIDAFFMKKGSNITATVVPFSSITAASSFQDMVFTERKAVVDYIRSKSKSSGDVKANNELSAFYSIDETTDASIKSSTYVPMNEDDYLNDSKFYGTASLMNPYSITKLVGSLGTITQEGSYVIPENNYLYDVRDQRRFYDLNLADSSTVKDILAVTSPKLRNIIAFSNSDKWGRTPYQYLDFIYSKWYGIIPNNRLITLRRYHAPTYDNLQFEGMVADGEQLINVRDKKNNNRTPTTIFSPRCTLVTYCGDETGNNLSDILKFTTGINWEDAEAKIWDVQGDLGEDPQSTIDRMFDKGGGFTGSDHSLLNSIINLGNTITGKILSFGKFLGATKMDFGMDQAAFDNVSKIQQDPYSNGVYANRIQGPLNRIDKVKKRKEGIIFDLSFTLKFSYKAKALGGINPKAAMLDILGNCLEMVSADALFWGGGHHFMINPKLYPYHDGGWRDSFMKKLYDGKIFGEGGAMDFAVKGVKNLASSGANGQDNGSIWDNLKSHLSNFLGEGLGAIGTLVSSAATSLFGEGSGNFLKDLGDSVSSLSTEEQKAAGNAKMNKLFGNLNNMWHNKVMATTMVPLIKGMNSLLIGEPVGEWHLTVGNPLNPIMVVGNLICEKMDVEFSNELGPDDFPEEMHVTYSLQHGMARDKAAIQSMFNRGFGKFYELPDYIKSASDLESAVDHYTGGTAFREPQWVSGPQLFAHQMELNGTTGEKTFQNYKVDLGKEPSNNGANAQTTFITKFTPPSPFAADFIGNGFAAPSQSNLIPIILSKGINRKYNN